mmetsp:Transcript_56318/g.98866  ORF Transcript_56318/g.98866 Transcript_56318/m.98866 type:complete len:238 (-) Transcript_56318:3-716(-)
MFSIYLFDVLVEYNGVGVLHKLAAAEGSVAGGADGGGVIQVVRAQHALDVHGGLLGVVEGHLGEQVMAHVCVRDVVQRAVHEEAEVSVHRADGAAQPVPLGTSEVRHKHVGVLQVGDQHQVLVDDHVRGDVVAPHVAEAEVVDGGDEKARSSEPGDVALHHEPVLVGLEEHGRGREMVRVLAVVLLRTRGVKHKVSGDPSHGEHEEDAPQVGDGSLAKHLTSPGSASSGGKPLIVLA